MKKTFRQTLSIFLSLALILSMTSAVTAAKFPDVTETDYGWAIDAIESMADDGIIKGYEDGTFGPAKTVSKLESLVLISRILGVNNKKCEKVVTNAWDVYGDTVAKYELPYGDKEVAYLVSKGILKTSDFKDYIVEEERNAALKRYEAAILLTKALGAEEEAEKMDDSALVYSDAAEIPAKAKAYVSYVSDIGLMKGMEDGSFAPSQTLTRAQAAIVLSKIQAMTDYDYKKGVLTYIDSSSRQFKALAPDGSAISHNITSEIKISYNGKSSAIKDIPVGCDVLVTYKSGVFYALDFTDALINDEIRAVYVGSSTSASKGTVITVNTIDDNSTTINKNKTDFKIDEDALITYNKTTCALSSIKSGSYLSLVVEDGIVTELRATDKESTFSGTVDSVILEPSYKLCIEDENGRIDEYFLDTIVKVTRNGKTVSAREILSGDSVKVTTNYGIIKTIVATSKTSTTKGIIKEVVISNTPRITLTIDGEDKTYFVKNDASITLSGEKATFYDLRVGMATNIKFESNTIVSVETGAIDEIITWAGTVTFVNSSYGLIQMEFTDSTTGQKRNESVFVTDKATIINYSTQKTIKLSSVTPGMKVNVTGSMNTGVFEASAVIIIG